MVSKSKFVQVSLKNKLNVCRFSPVENNFQIDFSKNENLTYRMFQINGHHQKNIKRCNLRSLEKRLAIYQWELFFAEAKK